MSPETPNTPVAPLTLPVVGAVPVSTWIHILVAAVVLSIANSWPVPVDQVTDSGSTKVPADWVPASSEVIPRKSSPLRPYKVGGSGQDVAAPSRVSHFMRS